MTYSPQFKSYPEGKIDFINLKVEKVKKSNSVLFNYNGKTNIHSETVGKEYFKSQGYNARFTENDVWKNLFHQLIYKNIRKLYESGEISTINEQRFDDEFYRENETAINKILNSLKDMDLKEFFENKYKNKNNISKRRQNNREKILTIVNHLENNQVLIVMEYMIKDYIHNRQGFPDLMVWNDEEIFFTEVKAGSDGLSGKQIRAHKTLQKAGINIVLFTINKNEKGVQRQKDGYTKRKLARTNYKGRYNQKLETANEKFESLKEQNDEEIFFDFNRNFGNDNIDYFIAYLNVLDKENINDLEELDEESIMEDILKQEELIRFLSIMAEARAFEDKHMFNDAIRRYGEIAEDIDNLHRYTAYKRICICYRKQNNLDEEFSIIKEIVNDNSVSKRDKLHFKNRIKRKLKNKDYVETEILCPKCKEEFLKVKEFRNMKVYSCLNCKHMVID